MTYAIVLAAAALYPQTAPESARIKAIERYFSPRPGTPFALDARDQREAPKTPVLKMRGFITVKPPKGVCFTIKVADDLPDEVVCKERSLAFAVGQLDRKGRLAWRVSVGPDDFVGTDLSWPSPYRIAMVTPWDAEDDDPQVYRFIEACEPSGGESGRRIGVRLLGGETWTIRFPKRDEMLPQPDAVPNLFMYSSNEKVSIKQAAEKEHESDHAAPEHDVPKEVPVRRKVDEAKEAVAPANPNDNIADRKWWAIPLRGAYVMPASNFQPRGSVASGMQGRCRYIFDLGQDDPGVGRLECHEVDGFKSVLLPLTCLKDIGPRR